MRNFCFPALLVMWGGVCVFFITFSVQVVDRIEDNLCLMNQTIQQDIKYYNDICSNPAKKEEYGVWRECIEKEHSLHKPLWRMAAVETAKQYGLCYQIRCEDFMLKSVYLMPMIASSVLIVLLLILLCGCMIMRYGMVKPTYVQQPQQTPGYYLPPSKNKTV